MGETAAPPSNDAREKTPLEVIRRIHMHLGHASRIAIQRTIDHDQLPYEKADGDRAVSNCGCNAGLHQARQPALVAPHRSLVVGHAIQVEMFLPAEYQTKSNPYLVTIDRFSRFAMCHRLSPHTAKDVAESILERRILVFGRPRKILTDRGTGMSGPEWGDMCATWNIVVVAHPTQASSQGVGHERAVGLIMQDIRAVMSFDSHTDIRRAVITACTGWNMSPLVSTGLTPMAIVIGRHSVFGF